MPVFALVVSLPVLISSFYSGRVTVHRSLDILIVLFALVILSPVLVIIFFTVKLSSDGGGIFKQSRVGRYGKEFAMFKFRTMYRANGNDSKSFSAGDTSRVTSVGSVLRRSKLDELPQLFNVLRGDMSIVGPRPEVRRWVDEYPALWEKVHTLRPGITDPASIEYRNEEELLVKAINPEKMYRDEVLPKKLALYTQYAQERSFLGDVKIIIKTLIAVFK